MEKIQGLFSKKLGTTVGGAAIILTIQGMDPNWQGACVAFVVGCYAFAQAYVDKS